jgi:hypothetical protein
LFLPKKSLTVRPRGTGAVFDSGRPLLDATDVAATLDALDRAE